MEYLTNIYHYSLFKDGGYLITIHQDRETKKGRYLTASEWGELMEAVAEFDATDEATETTTLNYLLDEYNLI